MRIVCLSDTHTAHQLVSVPKGDVLIFAGDAEFKEHMDVVYFNEWLGTLPHTQKIVIAGNHDFYAEKNYDKMTELLYNAKYLENEETTLINGMSIYGSPITPRFGDWAFMVNENQIDKFWDIIPSNLDLLVTHGPPFGILDVGLPRYGHVGCKSLLDAVELIKPKHHIFGHIHGSYGQQQAYGINFLNCSVMNEDYDVVNDPLIIDV